MKKITLSFGIVLTTTLAHAQTCPPTNTVYRMEKGVIKPYAPPGWMLSVSLDHLESTDLHFKYAAWDSSRIDPRDENRVMCIYANPDFPTFFIIETVNIIDRSLVESHPEWNAYGPTYLRCERSNPSECPFG